MDTVVEETQYSGYGDNRDTEEMNYNNDVRERDVRWWRRWRMGTSSDTRFDENIVMIHSIKKGMWVRMA